ncbi:glucosidase 2 subunit beta [Homalodisca vitripennis]|nr:glucosidase 2 subunit beta [Homalodisca vitripennis]
MLLKLFLAFNFLYSSVYCEILRPRGVPISKVSLYDPSIDFTCFDGLRTIPFKYVNDDYCDCNDGTDEPGTAACPNGIFHCTNAGHKSLNIPSSRVNDGICDCCDASDEYTTGNCSDVCYALGEVARQEAKQRAELLRQGSEVRQQLIARGKQMKQEKVNRVQSLQRDKSEAEAVKKEKEMLKQEAEAAESVALEAYRLVEEAERAKQQEEERAKEEQERFEYFKLIDSNMDGKIDISELQARQTFDQNKDGVVSEEEIKFLLGDLTEADWTQFSSEIFNRMKPFFMLEKGLFQPPSEQKEETEKEETTEPNQAEEWGDEDEEERNDDDEDEGDGEKEEGENTEVEHEEEDKPKYDPATQQLIDDADKARAEYENAERAVRDVERELKHLQDSLEKDYGPEDDFSALDGECFEYSDREYTYKLCPFDQVSQKPRAGGIETKLGTWSGWVGADIKYTAMLYDHGQSCWNGPQRSTYVEVLCGLDSVVTSASEPNRCEYRLTFTTPAACRPQETHSTVPHDEL